MRNNLTKIFAVMAMSVMTLTAYAGDFNGSNSSGKITLPSAVDLSYGTYTGFNRNEFFTSADKIEYSKAGAAARFTITVNEAATFLLSLEASNGNSASGGPWDCDLKVKIWSTGDSEPDDPNTTFTVADDNNWNNFVKYYYTTSSLAAGDYYLKIIWTDQANVQNIKFTPVYTPSTSVLPLTSTDNMTAYHYGHPDNNKNQAQLGYMDNNDYIEFAINHAETADMLVVFTASVATDRAAIVASLTNVSTFAVTSKTVNIANKGFNTYSFYKALFSELASGTYLLRLTFTVPSSYAPNFTNLKVMTPDHGIITPSSTAFPLTNTNAMTAYKFGSNNEKNIEDHLGSMYRDDYIEFPVYVTEDDYMVSFKASTNADNQVLNVSLIDVATSVETTKIVSVANKRNFNNFTYSNIFFADASSGTYLLRIDFPTVTEYNYAPSFGDLKLMSTAANKYVVNFDEVDLSTDWKTKAIINISDTRYQDQTNIEYTGDNDYVDFVLRNNYARKLNVSFEAATDADDRKIAVEWIGADGTLLSSTEKDITKGDWTTFNSYSVNDISLPAGYLIMRLRFIAASGNVANVKEIKVTSQPSYVREHPHMNLNTLCYPYRVDYYTGATFYTMLYKVLDGETVTDVYLQEHIGPLEAGTPYFYEPEDGAAELVCYYSGDRKETPLEVNGVKGVYEEDNVPEGSYAAYNGMLKKIGSGVTIAEYRAYVVMDEVAEKDDPGAPALVPGRRLLNIGGHKTPTGVENTSAAAIYGGSQKILRNGQIVIVKGDKMYNMLGQEL